MKNPLKRSQIKKIKAMENQSGNQTQDEITKKLLDQSREEAKLIDEFNKGKLNPIEFEQKFFPLEQNRIKTSLEFSGIKIEKKKEQ